MLDNPIYRSIFLSLCIIFTMYLATYLTYKNTGLNVSFFADENLEHKVGARIEKNIFLNTSGEPFIGTGINHFSVSYEGYLMAPQNNIYHIKIISDDGVRLWLNNTLVIDDWTAHPSKENTATVKLLKGNNKILLNYFDRTGEAKLDTLWKKNSEPHFKRIPTQALKHAN